MWGMKAAARGKGGWEERLGRMEVVVGVQGRYGWQVWVGRARELVGWGEGKR